MLNRAHVLSELEEQRCLFEEQRIEIQRMQRHITLQRELIALMQAELDTLKSQFPPSRKQTPRKPGNGFKLVTVGREAMSPD